MRVQLETITNKVNRSFSMMFNPRLSDLFFWHFHPEYELVFIEGGNGTRHVGDHLSYYEGSDLVLIGSGIPHLNFDYGLTGDYQKVVIHLKKDLVETHFQRIPELQVIHTLFRWARHGLAFDGEIKRKVRSLLFELENLPPGMQYRQLVDILFILAESRQVKLLHEKPYENRLSIKAQNRIQKVFAFIDNNFHRKIALEEVSTMSNMTKEAFCRHFKIMTQYTFTEFLNRYRISQSKRYLMAGSSVGDACFHSGFESLSYFNRIFKKVTGENPSVFRNRYN